MESDARGFAVGREIHLVAASHAHPREVQETLWHEVLHVGVTLAYESRTAAPYVQAMTQIASRNANLRNEATRWTAEEGSAFRRRLETQGIEGDALEQAVRLRAIEESLATLSGRAGERIHGLHKLTASVQGWMRSVGLQRVANWAESRTHAEALQMIVGFRRAVSTMMDTAPDDIERALQAPPSGRPHHGKVIGP